MKSDEFVFWLSGYLSAVRLITPDIERILTVLKTVRVDDKGLYAMRVNLGEPNE